MIGSRRIEAMVRPAGWLLAAVSAVFLLVVARRHWSAISSIRLTAEQWLLMAALAVLYGLSLLLIAAAWHSVLRFAGARPGGRLRSMRAHTTSQPAKYVPGNVFHLVGRHIIHRNAGMDDRRLAVAALVEALLMVACAASLVLLGIIVRPPAISDLARTVSIAGGALLVLLTLMACRRIARGAASDAAVACAAYLTFFAIMGGIIAAIVAIAGGSLTFGAAYGGVAAWIAGFVTPGAPGGLGIREAAMVLLGGEGGAANTEILFVAAALFRLVTFAGDLICFVLGRMLPDTARAA